MSDEQDASSQAGDDQSQADGSQRDDQSGTAAQDVASLPEFAQKLIRETRREAANYRTSCKSWKIATRASCRKRRTLWQLFSKSAMTPRRRFAPNAQNGRSRLRPARPTRSARMPSSVWYVTNSTLAMMSCRPILY